MVSTVHRFQGSQRQIIIFDVVDTFPLTHPGRLLSGIRGDISKRLINVAVSRAELQFILVGDIAFLTDRLSKNTTLYWVLQHMTRRATKVDPKSLQVCEVSRLAVSESAATKEPRAKRTKTSVGAAVVRHEESIQCPTRSRDLVIRASRRSRHLFLGCPICPRCRYTLSLTDELMLTLLLARNVTCPRCQAPLSGELGVYRPSVNLQCLSCGGRYSGQEAIQMLRPKKA